MLIPTQSEPVRRNRWLRCPSLGGEACEGNLYLLQSDEDEEFESYAEDEGGESSGE